MGWLSEEVERTFASWLNAHSVDNALNRPDWSLAEDAMGWRRSTLDGDQLTQQLSIRDLLDSIEGPDEHRVLVGEDDWKMTHPLTCRMRGLTKCEVVAWPDLMDVGEYALREGVWVDIAGDAQVSS